MLLTGLSLCRDLKMHQALGYIFIGKYYKEHLKCICALLEGNCLFNMFKIL